MHVARAEMAVGINALLDRLPNLRLDPDAEPPRYIGMYERGATAIPVVFDDEPANEPGYQAPDISLLGEEHIRRYRETDGEVGYLWNGVPTLLLTTTGRTQRGAAHLGADLRPRRRRLPRGRVDGRRADSTRPGTSTSPRTPPPRSRCNGERIPVTAHTASEDEKPRLWQIVTEVWPNYDVYQTRTDRVIPVVVLSPS